MKQPAGVQGVQAVDVPGGIDRRHHAQGVDMRGQRQLHEDAVDIVACIERLYSGKQIGLAGIIRQACDLAAQAEPFGHPDLALHIDLARRVTADQHDRKPRRAGQPVEFASNLVDDNLGMCMPIENVRRHGTSVSKRCPGARRSVSALPDGGPSKRQSRRWRRHSRPVGQRQFTLSRGSNGDELPSLLPVDRCRAGHLWG
ncbi:hypothetical protein AB7M59_007899 [Bradyrhizobium elkanii]